ncbi:dihydroorotase [Paremcibacter congregatus]|uniref:Dihydroorotase n=1 Tax=Paremcibacter congregatus TaxID=2043170 RepID=A0A2G4YMT9_9PROT|nr:dihydroorotase [Paremcibacter congregatus]PHZ83642.1 dihydroorotase [Paremcibacter congregatus]QDE27345.1 amidohydrolase family protein [Paremcibacter congregatus]
MSDFTLYKNARLLDPESGLDQPGDILIEGNSIARVGGQIDAPKDAKVVDCAGKCLCPGLIDMRVFVGIPGADYRDTIENTGESAAAGGVTTVCVQPVTDPIIDDLGRVEFLASRTTKAKVNFIPFPAITKQLSGKQMTEIGLMSKNGIKAFTDGNKSVANPALMTRVLKYASMFDALIIQHLAVPELSESGCMNAGALATRLGLPGIPTAAETIMLERDIRLLRSNPCRYHAAQITCQDSIEVVAAAKRDKLPVTAGVAVPHFSLNEYAIEEYRTFTKLSPPLRSEEDRVAVLNALKDGTIDVIVSGHDPEDPESKRVPFQEAEAGVVGLETMLPVSLELYHNGSLPLLDILAKMTCNPARLMGLETGALKEGAPADLCLFDLDTPNRVDPEKMVSLTKNTPFDGRPIQGRVLRTIVSGKTVFEYSV